MSKIENPFTNSEIQEIFNNQLNKVPFEVIKNVKDDEGKKWELKLDGRFIPDYCFDIWHDYYIVGFDKMNSTGGLCFAVNRFETLDELRQKIFKSFGLIERSQLSFF